MGVELVLEVKLASSGATVTTLSSSSPLLEVGDLQSGATYRLQLWHKNTHGESAPVELVVTTLVEPIKQMAETKMAGGLITKEESGNGALIVALLASCAVLISVAATMMAVVRRGRTLSSLPSSTTVSTSLLRESAVDQHGLTTISEDVNNIVNLPINNMLINNMVSMPVGNNSMVNTEKKNMRQQHHKQQQQKQQKHHHQQQQQQQQQQHQHQRLPMPPTMPRTNVVATETSFESNCCRIEPPGTLPPPPGYRGDMETLNS